MRKQIDIDLRAVAPFESSIQRRIKEAVCHPELHWRAAATEMLALRPMVKTSVCCDYGAETADKQTRGDKATPKIENGLMLSTK